MSWPVNWNEADLKGAVERAAELLPAQGPISAFVHHNTLHAFQHLPFHEAVLEAHDIYGCQPYMSEEFYHQALEAGRIEERDLLSALADTPSEELAPGLQLLALRLALLQQPFFHLEGPALEWHLAETPTLHGHVELWQSCQQAVLGLQFPPHKGRPRHRHRDLLREQGTADPDALVDPFLIRFCAAYLDQGQAEVPLPARERGLYPCFVHTYRSARWLPAWLQPLPGWLQPDSTALQSAQHSLQALGVQASQLFPLVLETLLTLKGWAGMLHQNQLRPDRMPVLALPGSLIDWLAVRLLLDRLALQHVAPQVEPGRLATQLGTSSTLHQSQANSAFQLFQIARRLALPASSLQAWSQRHLERVFEALHSFPALERRRRLQLAYERNFRQRALNALQQHACASLPQGGPCFQAIFCLDEREESTRRHLEEVEPACQTFGAPGFFSIPMYFKGVDEPHPLPLCPVSVRPRHLVVEVPHPRGQVQAERRAALRRSLGQVAQSLESSSRSLTLGSLVTAGLGLLAALPSMLRLTLPRLAGQLDRRMRERLWTSETLLEIERTQEQPGPDGLLRGFSLAEMTEIVRQQLELIGLTAGFSPLILVVGHGSSSLNNPHEAAYDCGACGGGRGGPNARVFAWMANHPQVRQALREQGLEIALEVRFVGAYHNTCAEDIEYYDLEGLTAEQLQVLERAAQALQAARARDALERCRRFLSASLELTPQQALRHVEERAADLAQPRPELGHATNAMCVLGRRSRTRGLFLDRRCFLASYDCSQDSGAERLRVQLAAVLPVVAGISLEYYFSRVDNSGYGCGSKLPHNITSLLGVMEGFCSDLRTGLPRQMIEIHEPMRLLVVVEAPLERLQELLDEPGSWQPLVRNGWIQLAQIDPDSPQLHWLEGSLWGAHQPDRQVATTADSLSWFHHHREDLDFAEISGDTRA